MSDVPGDDADDEEDGGSIDALLAAVARIPVRDMVRPVADTEVEEAAEPGAVIEEGVRLGRYRIAGLLGAGGMGIVFAAVDPDLDRHVAIKIMRRRHSSDANHAERLRREAQALARLSHSNVVTVYDVGLHDRDLYIVMQHVDGKTLDAHLAETQPGPGQILELFIAAGRGLVAAHAAGIVHRDFKPHNVLVGRDGSVRVSDFGLARETERPDPRLDELGKGLAVGSSLTKGGLIGTPQYMAPEQFEGGTVTQATDQFAFCIALWEALYGERPFAGATIGELCDAVLAGRRREPPPGRQVPRHVLDALERGLRVDPAARFASMTDLLAALVPPLRSRRSLWIGGALLIAGAATAGAFATRDAPAMSCGGDGFERVWNPGVRTTLATQFGKVRSSGAETAERTVAALDAFASQWRAARTAACGVRGKILDLQLHCLDRVANQAHLLVSELQKADGTLVDHAVDLVAGLSAPDACTADQLVDSLPIPADPRVAVIEQLLDEARVAGETEKRPAGREAATRALTIATALGHPMLMAEARALEATLDDQRDDTQIKRALEQALAEATQAGDHHLKAAITLELLSRVIDDGNTQAIETMLPLARAATANATERLQKRNFALYESQALTRLGRYDEALDACERIAPLEPAPYMRTADCRCQILADANRLPAAKIACEEALAAAEVTYGKNAAGTHVELSNLGIVLRKLHDYDGALAIRQRSIKLVSSTFGDDSVRMARERYGMALLLADLGKPAEAKRELEVALAVFSRGQTTPTKDMALVHLQLARARTDLGDLQGAADESDLAVHTLETVLGASHPNLAIALLNQGEANLAAKRAEVALASFTRGAALAEQVYGATHLVFGAHLLDRARALVELGRTREALPFAQRAVSIIEADKSDPQYRALAHATLGKVQLALGDRARGRAELTISRDAFRALGVPAKEHLEEVERLLGR